MVMWALLVIVVSAFIFEMFWLSHKDYQVKPQISVTRDVKGFWEKEILPIQNQLSRSEYPIIPLNLRFKEMGIEIKERYGKPLKIIAMQDYNPLGKDVMAQVRIESSEVVARLSISSLMDMYDKMQNIHTRWYEEYKLSVVVMLMHELEHLCGNVPSSRTNAYEDLVANEEYAWMKTCVNEIGPCVREGRVLNSNLFEYYVIWVKCGEEDNKKWHDFMVKKYSFAR